MKLANASPEIVTEYLRRIDRLRDEATAHGMTLVELSVRFAPVAPRRVDDRDISSATPAQVDDVVAAAERGPLPAALFERICREHVWVKNFYYFSKATVDGQPAHIDGLRHSAVGLRSS